MHIHGAPLDDEHHARSAVQTALDMLQACEEFNERRLQQALSTEDPGPLPPRVDLGARLKT